MRYSVRTAKVDGVDEEAVITTFGFLYHSNDVAYNPCVTVKTTIAPANGGPFHSSGRELSFKSEDWITGLYTSTPAILDLSFMRSEERLAELAKNAEATNAG